MKKALLIFHGFAGSPKHYDDLKKYLSTDENIDIFTFYMPGHKEDEVCKAKAMDYITASDFELQKLIDQGYEDITILGHSMGGAIASYIGAKRPEVTRIIIMSPAYSFLDKSDDIYSDPVRLKKAKKRFDRNFSQMFKLLKYYPPKAILEFKKLTRLCYSMIDELNKPTLYLHGDMDYVTPMYKSKQAYNGNKNNQKTYIVINNATHDIYECENSDFIYDTIQSFINDKKIPLGYYESVEEYIKKTNPKIK